MRMFSIIRLASLVVAAGALASCGAETAPPAEQPSDAAPEPLPTAPVSAEQADSKTPVGQAAVGDPIRGAGGLEEQCLAKVREITRAPVIGTNRIEESEAAIEIYVNVDGAAAPWKCLGHRDGSIGEVSFTGDEGAL